MTEKKCKVCGRDSSVTEVWRSFLFQETLCKDCFWWANSYQNQVREKEYEEYIESFPDYDPRD